VAGGSATPLFIGSDAGALGALAPNAVLVQAMRSVMA
jgi:hypothetical protein